MTPSPELHRENFKKWLDVHGDSPFSAAKKAGVSPGAIYNFLSGKTDSLSIGVLEKLARANDDVVDAILTGTSAHAENVTVVTHRIGSGGRMFVVGMEENITLYRPEGIQDKASDLAAALVEGQGLAPIPDGWAVFFRRDAEEADDLVGQLAIVRFSGGGPTPMVRTIRRSSVPGLHTLQAFDGTLLEDVEVVAAHRIVSFCVPSYTKH